MRTEIDGREVRLLRFADPALEFEAEFSAPPGARLDVRLWSEPGDSPSNETDASASSVADGQEAEGLGSPPTTTSCFRVKIHGCKRRDGGRYMLHGVAIDLRKEARQVLEIWSRGLLGRVAR